MTPESLCEQYSSAVCRFAGMAARSSSEAEDIAQEALLRAVRGLERFDASRGPMEAWLWRIVANVARDHQRADRRRFALWIRLRELWDGSGDSVESVAVERVDNSRLLEAVRSLPSRDQTLLALRFGADLDLHGVGGALGISPATAGRAVGRALLRLRTQLEGKPS